jgi:nicotinamide mononucleotide adenylyltransferase
MNKTTVIALCFVLVVGVVAGVEALNRSNSLEVVKIDKEESVKEVVQEVVQEVDVIDSANTELERINTELDQEETRLLEKKASNKADFEEKQLELENRLEKIRKTRTSFQ